MDKWSNTAQDREPLTPEQFQLLRDVIDGVAVEINNAGQR